MSHDIESQIEQMVAESGGRGPSGPTARPAHASMRLNHDGEFEVLDGHGLGEDPVGTLDHIDLEASHAEVIGRVETAIASLDEHTFDQTTGAKVMKLTGAARAQREREIEVLKVEAEYMTARYNQAMAARAARDAARAAEAEIDLAKLAYANGDPARMKALEKAIADEEAAELARQIVAARKAKAG